MISVITRTTVRHITDTNGDIRSVDYVEIRCKSADEKPTQDIANGSVCLVMDTREAFFFDEETGQWI